MQIAFRWVTRRGRAGGRGHPILSTGSPGWVGAEGGLAGRFQLDRNQLDTSSPEGNPSWQSPASQRLQLPLPRADTSSISIRRDLIIELGDFNGTGKFKCTGKYEYS